MALQMNVSGLRRNIKNIAHNYTDAQVKVREATSNDPWGPSSTLMGEIADLTYNVVAFTEIMQMIWKRLNDHGRNWRHVYKALVLLEYLIRTGSEKVSEQCRENIFAIQTLKDFQFLEENKDMGMNVREKAKTLVILLRDEERLLNERVRALKAKKRFAQNPSGIGSETDINSPSSPSYGDTYVTSSSRTEREAYGVADNARPQTIGEEELQLQLALAMSKEEAEQEDAKKKSDDVRLQMALNQSEHDPSPVLGHAPMAFGRTQERQRNQEESSLNDLLDINFNPNGTPKSFSVPPSLTPPAGIPSSVTDPWGLPVGGAAAAAAQPPHDPWASPSSAPSSRMTSPPNTDAWGSIASKSAEVNAASLTESKSDPWAPKSMPAAVALADPWAPVAKAELCVDPFAPIQSVMPSRDIDEFEVLSTRVKPASDGSSDPLSLVGLDDALTTNGDHFSLRPKSKSPAAFLGENSNLVNLDNLVSAKTSTAPISSARSTPANDWNENSGSGLQFSADTKPPSNDIFNNNNNTNALGASNPNYNPFTSNTFETPSVVAGANPFNSGPPAPNPFQAQQPPKPSMNQLRTMGIPPAEPSPWTAANNTDDPFAL